MKPGWGGWKAGLALGGRGGQCFDSRKPYKGQREDLGPCHQIKDTSLPRHTPTPHMPVSDLHR